MKLRWEQAFDDTPDVGDFLDEHGFVIGGELGHVGADSETRALVLAAPEMAELLRRVVGCDGYEDGPGPDWFVEVAALLARIDAQDTTPGA